jgi:hypothetical protein
LGSRNLQGFRPDDQTVESDNGENYIVVNYKANSVVKSIWILWNAEDRFFSPRGSNANARALNRDAAAGNIEMIVEPTRTRQ